MLIPTPESLLNIPTPPVPHAFLITRVNVHDPGKGDLVDLELPDHTYLRAQAGPDVLRLGLNLMGSWKATLHFDSHPTARLKEPLHLPRLTPLMPEEEALMPTWGSVGQVVKLDRLAGLVVIRVVPQRNALPAFTVTAIASLEQLSSVEHASHVRLKGSLQDRHLVVAQLEAIELPDILPRKEGLVSVYRSEIETFEPIRSNRGEGSGEPK